MEFKKYFGKFGIGWIIVGIVLTFLVFYVEWIAEYAGRIPYDWVEFVLVSIFLGFVPFIVAFFGLIRLFWLLICGTAILLLLLFLESGWELESNINYSTFNIIGVYRGDLGNRPLLP